jgi:subtilase family serine protease
MTALSDTVDLFGIGGHALNGALSPADLRNHYFVPQGLDGTGQTIAIVDGPGTGNTADDLNVYSAAFGLPQCNATNPCFTQVYAPASNNPGSTSADSGAEMALDTQMVHAIAPGASIVLVTANSSSFSDVASALVYAASLPGVTAVTLSASFWSADVSSFQAQERLLASIVANQGVILFASSGDNDTQFLNLGAPWPAGSASVTTVGGTRINSVASTLGANSEVAWTYSGGGWSLFASVPAWQSAYLSPTLVTANMGMKATPDVSAVADYQHSAVAIYQKERWLMSGGTSASSPIWAGISALLGQHLQAKQKALATLIMATPGGFNGLLYQTSQTSGSTPGIVDFMVGSNDLGSAPCSVCTATAGFDDVTGLGAPNVSNFISHY